MKSKSKSKIKNILSEKPIVKTTPKAKDESQKKLNDALREYDKRLRILQTQFEAQKKAINTLSSQNIQMLKAVDKIVNSIPNIDQGIKAIQRTNPSIEIAKGISKINSIITSEVKKSLKNIDLTSQFEKVLSDYSPSEGFIKAVEDLNPSDEINSAIEQFRQDWKYELNRAMSAFRETSEKRMQHDETLEARKVEDENEIGIEEDINKLEDEEELPVQKETEEQVSDELKSEDEEDEKNEQTYENLESNLKPY